MSQFPEGTPTVTVKLAGKSYELGWTMGAMKRAKKLGILGMDWEDKAEIAMALPSLVWSAMSKADREILAAEDVDEMVNRDNAEAVAVKIAELFTLSEPESTSGNAEPAPPKEARAGTKSTSMDSGQSESTISA